jgi:hypothetical protein
LNGRIARYAAAAAIAGAVLGVALIADQAPAHAARASSQRITLYAVASQDGFVNNADDRSRGLGNNPFGNYSNPFTTPPSNEHGYGPFAGDEALIAYKLYTGADLKTQSGTGIFVCQYNFGKNSVCDVSYSLSGGTLIATGAFNFTATTFRLAVTGGISGYRSATGIIDVTPSPIDRQAHPKLSAVIPVSCACRTLEAQRLAFTVQTP